MISRLKNNPIANFKEKIRLVLIEEMDDPDLTNVGKTSSLGYEFLFDKAAHRLLAMFWDEVTYGQYFTEARDARNIKSAD